MQVFLSHVNNSSVISAKPLSLFLGYYSGEEEKRKGELGFI